MTAAPARSGGRPRAVFFGSPAFAVPCLRAVAAETELVAVVSQPDRPAGRGQAPAAPAVKREAEALGVPVLQPEKSARPRRTRRWPRSAPICSWWSPTGGSCRRRCWICRGWDRSTCTPRCSPSCAARRRSSGRSSAASARPACRSCGWRRGSTPGRSPRCGRWRSPTTTRPGRCRSSWPSSAPGCWSTRCRPSSTGRSPSQRQDDSAATLAPLLAQGGRDLNFDQPARLVSAQARGVDPWPGATTTLGGESLKLFAPRVVAAASVGVHAATSRRG